MQNIIDNLQENQKIFIETLSGMKQQQAKWRPEAGKWSILEVVNHLYDEECLDFRKRIQSTIENPKKEWPPIDPEGWVREKQYNDREIQDSLKKFLKERIRSIQWLQSYQQLDWETRYNHPVLGPLHAGDLLISWLAHDFLHLRQILNLKILYLQDGSKPFSTRYAMP